MTDERPPDGGHEDPLLRTVAEYWGDIQREADPRQLERLSGLLDGTAEADPGVARAKLTDLLLDVLPPHHPLVEWLLTAPLYASGGKQGPDAVTIGEGHLAGSVLLAADTVPVTIYLTDEQYHEQVESAVEALLVTAGRARG